jgi:hypothetical protein
MGVLRERVSVIRVHFDCQERKEEILSFLSPYAEVPSLNLSVHYLHSAWRFLLSKFVQSRVLAIDLLWGRLCSSLINLSRSVGTPMKVTGCQTAAGSVLRHCTRYQHGQIRAAVINNLTIIRVDPGFSCFHRVDVGCVADVSEEHTAFIIWTSSTVLHMYWKNCPYIFCVTETRWMEAVCFPETSAIQST